MIASLLTDEPVTIHRVPDLSDTAVLVELLTSLGKKVELIDGTAIITQEQPLRSIAPAHLIEKMRASIIILGPLLARCGEATLSLPGGCSFGERPVDLHLFGMKQLGAIIDQKDQEIYAHTEKLIGSEITLSGPMGPTVLGTDNVMMAAVLAQGITTIHDAAREPECVQLATMLVAMGAQIEGIGTSTITITGVANLSGCEVSVIPDRIETISYLIAGLASGGEVTVTDTEPDHITGVLDILKEVGCEISVSGNTITAKRGETLTPFNITTEPYPGLATDLQSLFAVLALTIPGDSTITETIYPQRFAYAHELLKMGAGISFIEGSITIHGGKILHPAHVVSTDLRAGCALAITGLITKGETELTNIGHILRGYEHFTDKIASLGGTITLPNSIDQV